MISPFGVKSLQKHKAKRDLATSKRYADTAEKVAVEWAKDPDIVAIVALGGVARKDVDRHSDIDLAVFIKSAKTNRIRAGEYAYDGCPLDILLFRYPSAFGRDWDDVQREAFSNFVVLADKTGNLARLIRKKVKLSRSEVRQRIASRIMYLAWLGIYSKKLAKKQSRTYHWDLPADLLARRGELVGAHGLLQRCTDLVVQLLFAANERPVPDYKWRFSRVFRLSWLPHDFASLFRDALTVKSLSPEELRRRIRALEAIVEDISTHAEQRGLLPQRVYPYFLRESPDYEIF